MRDVAYWPRAFLDEIEQAVVTGPPTLWSPLRLSFLYRTAETTIWIDPYFGGTPDDAVPDAYRACPIPVNPDEIRAADIVISTHDHVDHCHEGTVMPIIGNTDAFCVAPSTSATLMRAWGVPPARVREVSPGDALAIGDVEISVHGAADPGEPGAVTFVLESAGSKLFVSGTQPPVRRSSRSSEPSRLCASRVRPDVHGRGPDARGCARFSLRTLVPFHWEFWRNHTGDIVRLFELYHRDRPPFDLKILLIGDLPDLDAEQTTGLSSPRAIHSQLFAHSFTHEQFAGGSIPILVREENPPRPMPGC